MLLKPERMADIGAVATSSSGKKVFISGALPGEEVEVEIVKEYAKYDTAVATKVLKASEHRVDPKVTSTW